jgi:hypothetical protein
LNGDSVTALRNAGLDLPTDPVHAIIAVFKEAEGCAPDKIHFVHGIAFEAELAPIANLLAELSNATPEQAQIVRETIAALETLKSSTGSIPMRKTLKERTEAALGELEDGLEGIRRAILASKSEQLRERKPPTKDADDAVAGRAKKLRGTEQAISRIRTPRVGFAESRSQCSRTRS